jgi:hypothetical protein
VFFSPPHQSNEPRLRITEDSLYVCQRMETGKRVRIRQPTGLARFGHPAIMPNFPMSSTLAELGKTSLARLSGTNCYPLGFTKSQNIVLEEFAVRLTTDLFNQIAEEHIA